MQITLHLSKPDGTTVGDVAVSDFNSFTRIPPDLAVQVINLAEGWTPDMLLSGELYAMVAITPSGQPEYVVGRPIRPEQSEVLSSKGNLECDSYVLKADGSIER
jgi:hypothetical protein